MPYDYNRIRNITFNSLKDGKLCKEDIVAMIEYYKSVEDFNYCNALIIAWREYQSQPEKIREIWKYLGKTKN
jgi:hypothetical protein